jgi:hypothetical protein
MKSKDKTDGSTTITVFWDVVRITIVTYRPIARQRLSKHNTAGADARKIRTSIARKRISKHA